jgi:hypothetical protein
MKDTELSQNISFYKKRYASVMKNKKVLRLSIKTFEAVDMFWSLVLRPMLEDLSL